MNKTIKKIIKIVVRLILRPPVLLYRYIKDRLNEREKDNEESLFLEFFLGLKTSLVSICRKIMELSEKTILTIKDALQRAQRINRENKELKSLNSSLEIAQKKHILKIQQLQEENNNLKVQLKKKQDELESLSKSKESIQHIAPVEIPQSKEEESSKYGEIDTTTDCIDKDDEKPEIYLGSLYAAPSADGLELVNVTKVFNQYNSVYEISSDGTFSVCDNDEVVKKAIKNRDYLLKPCIIVNSSQSPALISTLSKGVAVKQENEKWKVIQKVQIKLV